MVDDLLELQILRRTIAEIEQDLAVKRTAMCALEAKVMAKFGDTQIERVTTAMGSVQLYRKKVPRVLEWSKFYDHIAKTDSFYLLERRPSVKACVEAVEMDGLPGVEITSFNRLKYTTT